ncbi:MAG: spondin domain-containing protein [Blastocatellia bacterium]
MTQGKRFLALAVMATMIAGQMLTASFANPKKDGAAVKFTVRVENISSRDGQTARDGGKWPFALSPGFYAVHMKEVRFFNEGKPVAPNGLEMQAEDGNSQGMVDYLMGHHSEMQHGVFNMPAGAETPGPIGPGGVYEFSFNATPGMKLSLVTMFGQSNDWFYASEPGGIKLFNNDKPLSGDITSNFILWDAGTEKDEEPGVGANQAPRQKAPNTGDAENGKVHRVKDGRFANQTAQFFKVTVTAN